MVFPWPLVASGGPPGPFSGQHLALLSCFSTNKNPVLVAPEALDYSVNHLQVRLAAIHNHITGTCSCLLTRLPVLSSTKNCQQCKLSEAKGMLHLQDKYWHLLDQFWYKRTNHQIDF